MPGIFTASYLKVTHKFSIKIHICKIQYVGDSDSDPFSLDILQGPGIYLLPHLLSPCPLSCLTSSHRIITALPLRRDVIFGFLPTLKPRANTTSSGEASGMYQLDRKCGGGGWWRGSWALFTPVTTARGPRLTPGVSAAATMPRAGTQSQDLSSQDPSPVLLGRPIPDGMGSETRRSRASGCVCGGEAAGCASLQSLPEAGRGHTQHNGKEGF